MDDWALMLRAGRETSPQLQEARSGMKEHKPHPHLLATTLCVLAHTQFSLPWDKPGQTLDVDMVPGRLCTAQSLPISV
jgi:hypothetical protein